MLGHRLRRWPNITPTSDERLIVSVWLIVITNTYSIKSVRDLTRIDPELGCCPIL